MDVVLWWHLHQPDYREPSGQVAGLPWVRMHALRAYTDLPSFLLEEGPIGMTINIVPSLADQLVDIATGRVQDRHYQLARALLAGNDEVISESFAYHAAPAPRPMRPLQRLDALRALASTHGAPTRAEALDACVLFHLSWVGFTLFRDVNVQRLFEKGAGFHDDDLRYLLDLSVEAVRQVLPRLRHANEQGACHLTTTPYYHPILPLIIDTSSAKAATRDQQAPPPFGSIDDARRQVERALQRHTELFGNTPTAMWPAEGSLSEDALSVFADAGVEVVASDEMLLRKSLASDPLDISIHDAHLQPWHHHASDVTVLFRDRRLSDDWGFVYRELAPEQTGRAFVEGVRARRDRGGTLCSVILDGENPFEHYPDAGLQHLRGFAKAVSEDIRFVAPSSARHAKCRALPRLATGSWIDASFDIWAGDEEDRRAWQLLAKVHTLVESAIEAGQGDPERAREHLLAAEGSDWFWWYGPEFPISDRGRFDTLFRHHLIAAMDACHLPIDNVPELRQSLLDSHRRPRGRSPRPIVASPTLHDEASAGWAWRNAAFAEADPSQGSMHRGAPLITNVGALCSPREARIRVHVRDDVTSLQLRIYHGEREHLVDVPLHAAAGTILRGEHDVCWQDFGVKTGDTLWLRAEAHLGDAASATLPQAEQDRISLQRPSSWSIEA